MSKKHQEHIIAVYADRFPKTTPEQKMYQYPVEGKDVILAQREHLEEDNRFRQLIPYLVIRKGDKIAAYKRTKTSGEGRLVASISVGFGGHMDGKDLVFDENSIIDLDATLNVAIERELQEELGDEFVAKINQNSNNPIELTDYKIIDDKRLVEQVHMGVVVFIDVPEDLELKAAEDKLEILGFLSADDIRAAGELEPWSEYVLESFAK